MENINKEKEHINVNILLDNGSFNTQKDTYITGDQTYSGMSWDIWHEIKQPLEKKYIFKVIFTPEKDWRSNHNAVIQNVEDGKYDIVIGPFMNTTERKQMVNFTQPIALDGVAILHKNKTTFLRRLINTLTPFLKAAVLLIVFGIVAGFVLNYHDPKRGKFLNTVKNSKNKSLLRAVLTGISSMFGEMGYLSENATLTIGTLIMVIIIMLFATLMLNFIQAEITATNIEARQNDSINKINLKNFSPYLGFKNAAPVNVLQKYDNIQVTYLRQGTTTKQAVKEYNNKSPQYGGYITTKALGFDLVRENQNMFLSYGDFGYAPVSFIVNKRKQNFLQDIDIELLKLKENSRLEKICRTYFPETLGNHHICSLR
jgi:hypothetical protein